MVDSESESIVELEGVGVTYGAFQALRDVSLSIPRGAVGLVGRNGAGKSTLLKVLLGLVEPSSGTGSILGIDVRGAGDRLRRSIGYMPENDAFILGMWGVEQTALAGELCGLSSREALRRAHEVLAYVDLGEARYRPVEQYSTGMRQRLKLAVALIHDPKLLLLDEPTVGLDPPGRQRMLDLIGDLVREHGKSLVISTHLLGDVERTCGHVVMIEAGRVIAAGTLKEILGSGDVRYRVRWTGESDGFLSALERDGGALEPAADELRVSSSAKVREARLAMPGGYDPRRFFEVAREQGVTLLTMETDHGDLSEIYHRLLDGDATHGR